MTQPQILIQEMSFNLPNGKALFNQLNIAFSKQKIGLIGNNGTGKSTLIKLIAGELQPSLGSIQIEGRICYIQQSSHYPIGFTVADLLGHADKLNALYRIEQGSTDLNDFTLLNDDWLVKEKLRDELAKFALGALKLDSKINTLSGGELTRLLLTKAFSSDSDFLLLDEPSNHLDQYARTNLHQAILNWERGLIVVSHDRNLLNLMDEIVEISSLGVSSYGGNYDFYKKQKDCINAANQDQLSEAKNALKKTKQSIQLTKEKHEQRQANGKELRKRGDQPKVLLDAMENRSTRSLGSLSIRHNSMLQSAQDKLRAARENIEIADEIHISLSETHVPNGKLILNIANVSFSYLESSEKIIKNFDLTIQGPERIAISGSNGSGKSTLIKLIMNARLPNNHRDLQLIPSQGEINIGTDRINYLDQNANQLNPELSLLDNFLSLNCDANENEAYQALAQFAFKNTSALKKVRHLSGGEKLRALLACILKSSQPPQLLILDEPTNHLDLNSMISIESVLKEYQGAMIVISHDAIFLDKIGIKKIIQAPFFG